jgi:hypothetical protein
MDKLELFLAGKSFTWAILSLYGLRAFSYIFTGHYGPACYWISASMITISAEFLFTKWP